MCDTWKCLTEQRIAGCYLISKFNSVLIDKLSQVIVNEPKEADGELRSGNMFDRECVEDFHKKKSYKGS